MKKLLLSLALVGLLVLALSWTANAADPITPTVIAVEPVSGFNDIETRITITGTDFTVDASATPTATPTVTLGTTPLTDVTWVDTQTLTATVPWGMAADTYDLTVTNPGSGSDTLAAAFTVEQGLGQWNSGELNGANVPQILMKPGDPSTLYALAYDVGIFRSRDAGGSWAFTSANVTGNADLVLDPNPGHESRLYMYMWDGLYRSEDEGDSWAQLYDTGHDAGRGSAEVFVSPHDPDVLFLAMWGEDATRSAKGLLKSSNGGLTFPAASMVGTEVLSVAFDPDDPSDMVLATPDARVFASADGGDTWSQVATPPLSSGLGMGGGIAYNPYGTGEVWIWSTENPAGGIYRSTGALTEWHDVSPTPGGGDRVSFATADSVYSAGLHSIDGGESWDPFGPSTCTGAIAFDSTGTVDPEVCYAGDWKAGVQKTVDGGGSWEVESQGLTGMRCFSMAVSEADPLRVYAAFVAWPGIYRSDNGTTDWTYLPIEGSGQVWQVREDPFVPTTLYASGAGFYVSEDEGETWTDLGWNRPPGSDTGALDIMEADPYHPGHLLGACRVATEGHDVGLLYSTTDYGVSWQSIAVTTAPDTLAPIMGITFDPETTGTVYLTTSGTGIYKSVDDGAAWDRIDDLSQPMQDSVSGITIATQPQHVLAVPTLGGLFRSSADDVEWQGPGGVGSGDGVAVNTCSFVDRDSTRLYAATWSGLYFSSNVGDSWSRAAGVLGTVQATRLADTNVDGHTLLYAATTGGDADAGAAAAPLSSAKAPVTLATPLADPPSTLVGAGIYRRAQVPVTTTFYSWGSRDGWILESSEHSGKGGTLSSGSTTLRLGDSASKKQYRGVLSFNTGPGLPDGAVITGVTLRIRKQGVTGGGDPVAKFQGFVADVRNGYFGTSTYLRTSDFQAAATRSDGPFKPPVVGGWYSIDLTGAKAYVNKLSTRAGLTQVRLRFKLDDNNNRIANYLRLYSGNASSSSRPRLIVTYYTP